MARVKMPMLDIEKCRTTFDEVNTGFTHEQAIKEASRCLNCKNAPCIKGCPVSNNIPEFIKYITTSEFDKANDALKPHINLSSICGRVCPQENHCEKNCIAAKVKDKEAIAIGSLARYLTDYHEYHPEITNKKREESIAVIGSGPSGLACAINLLEKGFNVTIYEALHKIGGVLIYGIPSFRLPRDVIDKQIETIKQLGGKFITNVVIGKTITIEELLNEIKYSAIYIASGAGLPKFMNIPGENYNGVVSANEFLTRVNLMSADKAHTDTPLTKNKIVAVIGAGNVAIDAARCALRLGSEKVYIIYRRGLEDAPARKEELEHAISEGIDFRFFVNPIQFVGNDDFNVTSMKCVKMQPHEPEGNTGKRSVTVIPDSEFDIEVDLIIEALGTDVNPLIIQNTKELNINKWGCITVDENQYTSIKGVFAGGDATSGAATVIDAVKAGKNAAKNIEDYLNNL